MTSPKSNPDVVRPAAVGELESLIARLEEAAGPDREIDSAIARSLEHLPTKPFESEAPFERMRGMYWVFGTKDTPNGPVEEKWSKTPPLYTFSIDAALTLVPVGWQWQVSNRAPSPHTGRAYLNNNQLINIGISGLTPNPKYRGTETTAATPAIAICISALRARSAAQ